MLSMIFPFNFIISSYFSHVSGKKGKISFHFMYGEEEITFFRERNEILNKWKLHYKIFYRVKFKLKSKISSSSNISSIYSNIFEKIIIGAITLCMVNNFNLIFIAKTTFMFETIFSLLFTNAMFMHLANAFHNPTYVYNLSKAS